MLHHRCKVASSSLKFSSKLKPYENRTATPVTYTRIKSLLPLNHVGYALFGSIIGQGHAINHTISYGDRSSGVFLITIKTFSYYGVLALYYQEFFLI